MPRTTSLEYGDVLLVPFLFTDLRASKRRPAIVVSSDAYHQEHPDLILVALTSQIGGRARTGELLSAGGKKPG